MLHDSRHGPAPLDELSVRIRRLRKHYARGHGRPTFLQSAAMLHAAKLTAQAELAVSDPTKTPTEVIALDRAARRARNEMRAVMASATDAVPDWDELDRRHRQQEATP